MTWLDQGGDELRRTAETAARQATEHQEDDTITGPELVPWWIVAGAAEATINAVEVDALVSRWHATTKRHRHGPRNRDRAEAAERAEATAAMNAVEAAASYAGFAFMEAAKAAWTTARVPVKGGRGKAARSVWEQTRETTDQEQREARVRIDRIAAALIAAPTGSGARLTVVRDLAYGTDPWMVREVWRELRLPDFDLAGRYLQPLIDTD